MTPQEHERIRADIASLMAETMRLHAAMAKTTPDRWWHPVALIAAAVGVSATLTKLFLV